VSLVHILVEVFNTVNARTDFNITDFNINVRIVREREKRIVRNDARICQYMALLIHDRVVKLIQFLACPAALPPGCGEQGGPAVACGGSLRRSGELSCL
jgi:hypothetical protein